MISAISSALSGILSASKQVEASASNIANATAKNSGADSLIEDIVDIKTAEISFKANIEVLNIENELSKELLNSFDKKV